METIQINYTAILVAVIANFILGFIWYTPLFGKAWAREVGLDVNVKPQPMELVRGMVIMIVGNFLMAFVFAHNNAAWSFVPGMADQSKVVLIMNASIFTWLGFYLPVDIGVVTWERRSWKLFAINTGYHLMMLIVAATVLTLM
ncbi:MAG: DUF1761 domain-containing protein [Cyclobacteriaceae bacterium]|jgi:hypothetical protein|nr:DUF1761 domain-containing protein [Cyclobacteriaceae bacterium]HQQ84137.1 DUF1761 domain-containing protein [Cyclobacteriaceae bacterium]